MLTVGSKKFDWANISLKDCVDGNAMDTIATLHLYNILQAYLEDTNPDALKVIEHIYNPAIEVVADLERHGLNVDPKILKKIGRDLEALNVEEHDRMYEYDEVDIKDSLASAGLTGILFTKDTGFAMYPTEDTPGGKPSTNKDSLEILLDYIEQELVNRNK